METNDSELRQIYRSYVSGRIRTGIEGCPPIADVRRAFENAIPRGIKDKIVDHLSSCADCALEFEFIREARTTEKELALMVRKVSRLRRPRGLFFPRPLRSYALGILMIVIVITCVIMLKQDLPRDVGRNRSATIPESVSPSGHIDAHPPLIFIWKPAVRAVSYVVEVYDESLQSVWESPPISTTAAILPDQIRLTLSRGKSYYWLVQAFDSDGKIGESRFEAFCIDQ